MLKPSSIGKKLFFSRENSYKPTQSLGRTILKIESSYKNPISKSSILHLGQEHNLQISSRSSFVNLKRRKKLSLTVLSGPHVHKKSREQFVYKTSKVSISFTFQNAADLNLFIFALNQIEIPGVEMKVITKEWKYITF